VHVATTYALLGAIIPNLSAISRYRGLSVIESCGTVGGSPRPGAAPGRLGRLRGDTAQSEHFGAEVRTEAITSDVVST
jgi:hypothetical protein